VSNINKWSHANFTDFNPDMVFQTFYFSAFKDVQAILFPYGGLFVQLQRKIKTIFIHQVLTNIKNSICSSRAHQVMLS
jgi:hypothetical protein